MSTCVEVNSGSYNIRPVTQRPLLVKEVVFHCETLETAVTEVLTKANPNILAIGERHPDSANESVNTTLQEFTERMLPLLKKQGFRTIVLEMVLSDPVSDQMIKAFLGGKASIGQVKPYFYPSNNINRYGLLSLFHLANHLNKDNKGQEITIVGGGPMKRDQETPYIYEATPDKKLSQKKLTALHNRITQRTGQKIYRQLASGKKKVISYNGGHHNDAIDYFGLLTIPRYLKGRTKAKYIELDLLSPEMIRADKAGNYTYPEYERWLKFAVPKTGVNLIKRGDNSYTIIFPEKTIIP